MSDILIDFPRLGVVQKGATPCIVALLDVRGIG